MTGGPGAVLAGIVAAVLAGTVALGTGQAPAAAVPTSAVTAGGVATTASQAGGVGPDYATGPYASRLCGGGSGDLVCVATRAVAAMVQGSQQRDGAVAQGGSCEVQSGLWVCFGVESVLAQRGGTTYGDTFLTSRPRETLDADLVAHELEHVRQWRLFGPDFALMYLLAGADACSNDFEIAAGLDAGGYICS